MLEEMTKNEFQKKVIELLKKYNLNNNLKERIIPLLTMAEDLNNEEMAKIYAIVEEIITTQEKATKATLRLKKTFNNVRITLLNVSRSLYEIKERLESLHNDIEFLVHDNKIVSGKNLNTKTSGNRMQYSKQSFPGEKPNFGLKLNKLFPSYITEYGPSYITMVISDSIIYTNNLILRISLKSKEVCIGSSKSLKLYETKSGYNFLVTEKPEVIPFGNKKRFYFKNITYEDILNLTNGDFFKVFDINILKTYKNYQVDLPGDLKKVGYYKFE